MSTKNPEKELSCRICVICDGKMPKIEDSVAKTDDTWCPVCSEDLKLEPSSEEGE
jgi:hypothetical protein